MTMHIDESLLANVMKTYGLESKTEAVHYALNELDRRAKLRVFAKEGLGLSPEDFVDAIDPASYGISDSLAAEEPISYATSARPD